MKSTDFRNLTAQDISDLLYVIIKQKQDIKVVDDNTKMYIIMPTGFRETEQAEKLFKNRPKHEVNLASGDWMDEDVSDLL